VGSDTLILQTSQGCDSLVITNTDLEGIPLTEINNSTCQIEQVGVSFDTLTSVAGCDSIVQYNLTFDPGFQTNLPDAFSCDELEWGEDTTIISGSNGCDSLLIQETLPATPAETVLDTQICARESLLFGSQLIESEGTYFDTLFTIAGCDSIIILNVAVTSDAPFPVTEYLCPGDTVIFGGDLITGSGQFTETFTDQFGCDSTVILTVEGIDVEAFSLTPDEQIILEGNSSTSFSVTDNDQLPSDYELYVTPPPLHGSASLSGEGELTYELTNTSFLGVDSFGYQVCTQLCIDTCLETSIHISTLTDCLTEIQANLPTGFTPDGDGFNDELNPLQKVFDVGCLQGPERAAMRVLNRWGEVVFEADPYRSWDGRYTNGQFVPQGTYYYILTFELDGERVITEYVHVLRTE
jgi:gliding motility-associated-like protein